MIKNNDIFEIKREIILEIEVSRLSDQSVI